MINRCKVMIGRFADTEAYRRERDALGAGWLPHEIQNFSFIRSGEDLDPLDIYEGEGPCIDYDEINRIQGRIEQTVPESIPTPPVTDEEIPF